MISKLWTEINHCLKNRLEQPYEYEYLVSTSMSIINTRNWGGEVPMVISMPTGRKQDLFDV